MRHKKKRLVVFESLFSLKACVALSKLLIHMNTGSFICKYYDNNNSALERLCRVQTNQKGCLADGTGCQPVGCVGADQLNVSPGCGD